MASVETSGPTVDDAIDAALEKLDLDEDQVDLEILSEGGDGQPARVRATPRTEIETSLNSETGLETGEVEWDENLATAGREIVEDLLDYMGFPGEVDVLRAGKENGTPTLALAVVDGESMGALIGRRGETLQAFQFITQLLVNRRLGHWTRVLLDIEGYRSRRERYLKDTALRAAEKAMRYRESIELDPMIPSERRIVHLTLATHEFVTTHSEGEGDNRRVIIEPTPEYVQQHGGPVERSERPPGPGGRGGFSRGGRSGGGRGRGGYGGGFRR
ncbi:MAG TPA: RNA-binding cell elongation regulator Jag/EloR [Chloroflexota bacterium]